MVAYDFSDKTVIITGAGGRIGSSLSRRFTAAGARVVLSDLNGTSLEAVAQSIPATGGRVHTHCGDIAEASAIDSLFALVDNLGGADVLVNNAGLVQTYKPFPETTLEDWDRIFAVNLRATYYASLCAVKRWIATGRAGCIINLSSPGAIRAHRDNSIYDASKGGMDALTRAMTVDLSAYGIRINAIAPAAVQETAEPRREIPLGRNGTTDDVAQAALFLASSGASFISGQVLPVDGGLLAQLRSPSR